MKHLAQQAHVISQRPTRVFKEVRPGAYRIVEGESLDDDEDTLPGISGLRKKTTVQK